MAARIAAIAVAFLFAGCQFGPGGSFGLIPGGGPPPVALLHANPSQIPSINRDVFWNTLVDVVDDYFDIQQEDRVKLLENVVTEGRIETWPQGGATYLEPHRSDSLGPYNRLEATLQTIRRICHVRVVPNQAGYLVEIAVLKELEDKRSPDRTTAGAAVFGFNTSPHEREEFLENSFQPLPDAPEGWISLGRDAVLEQAMLADLHARLGIAGGAVEVPGAQ